MHKIRFPGELALGLVLVFNSLAVCLMAKSGFGISTISSVPYVFSAVFSFFSFGTWNYIFQTALIFTLMCMRRTFYPSYLFSFVIGILFGKIIDIHEAWLALLPEGMVWRLIYFAAGFVMIAFGICLANNCLLPIVPTDVFPRDFAQLRHLTYKRVKTTFDLICLAVTLGLSVILLHTIYGIGIGTVVSALLTGRAVSLCQRIMDRRLVFYRALRRPASSV